MRDDHVECEPTNPVRRCTPLSIANHALHENSSPIHHIEPGGMLDTSECRFEAISDRAVRITGMRWNPAERYTVKLEGVELAGYRAICVCGTRDPMLIGRFDDFLDSVRAEVAAKAAAFGATPDSLQTRYPGLRPRRRDGRRGSRSRNALPHELGFVIEVVARDSQEIANAVLGMARTNMLHTDFPGPVVPGGQHGVPVLAVRHRGRAGLPVQRLPRGANWTTRTEMFPIEYETV